jgi:hypothetical protein
MHLEDAGLGSFPSQKGRVESAGNEGPLTTATEGDLLDVAAMGDGAPARARWA